jgi:hypothetical protein
MSQPALSANQKINWGFHNSSPFLSSEFFKTLCVCRLFSNLKSKDDDPDVRKSVWAQTRALIIQIKSFVRLYHITAQQTDAEPSAFVYMALIPESPVGLLVKDFLFLYHLTTAYSLQLRLALSISHRAWVTMLVMRHYTHDDYNSYDLLLLPIKWLSHDLRRD